MKKTRRNLVGMKFGEWTVLSYMGSSKWLCECSCGTRRELTTGKLTCGQTASCGHNKLIDLVGKQFGEWKVLKYAGNMKWLCQCSCGVIREVNGKNLRDGTSTSCGHTKVIDLTGSIHGELEVIKYAGNKMWICKCSCGKIKLINGYRLRNNEVKSCGHLSGFTSLIGESFGKLKVVKYSGNGKYICKCSCGNIIEVLASNLRNNSTNSCGCLKKQRISKDELQKAIDNYIELNGKRPNPYNIANIFDISYEYVIKLLIEYELRDRVDKYYSNKENEIYEYVTSLIKPEYVIRCDRTVLSDKKELDIYIPSKKLAIEFNGNYWHSKLFKSETYHQAKTIECDKLGIQLIHIFEYEWDDEEQQIKLKQYLKEMICGYDKIVHARDCEVRQVNKSEITNVAEFLSKYHLQGYTDAKVYYALYLNNEMVSIMLFDIPKFNSCAEWELIRYCTKQGIRVIGGAEKLLSSFILENNPINIISYCDISKFNGCIYKHLGFKETGITYPSYAWIKGREIIYDYAFQKSNLIDKELSIYGSNEDEIMTNLGYYRVYNSGNKVFIWEK